MKRSKINYEYYADFWHGFFEGKGLQKVYSDEDFDDFFACYQGAVEGSSDIIVTVYAGDYRTDTKTRGCIGADFEKNYNKLSQMPVYADLDIDGEDLWKAVLLMVSHEKDFPEKYSSIEKDENGEWRCIEWTA